jgi:glycosyltransferase involved in cell wall biosynthesis
MSAAYKSCDVVVDLGPCMRRRLERYGGSPLRETLTPWALVEPDRPPAPAASMRREMFGDAKLGLVYAGSMSRSHDFDTLLALARACRARAGDEIGICFACTGTSLPALKSAVRAEDTNIRFAPFGDEAMLESRLAAADIHLGSLRPEFTGIVVPSKFFAALAVGRPFIFAGSREASIAQWIREYDVGWVLEPGRADEVASQLAQLRDDPATLRARGHAAMAAYRRSFSKRLINDRWASLLEQAVGAQPAHTTSVTK